MTRTTPAEVRAAVAWAERMLERTLLDHPEDDKHLRRLSAELARLTCAVGECEGALGDMLKAFADPMTRRALGGHSEVQMLAVTRARTALNTKEA